MGVCGVLPAFPYAIGDNFTLTFIASSKRSWKVVQRTVVSSSLTVLLSTTVSVIEFLELSVDEATLIARSIVYVRTEGF